MDRKIRGWGNFDSLEFHLPICMHKNPTLRIFCLILLFNQPLYFAVTISYGHTGTTDDSVSIWHPNCDRDVHIFSSNQSTLNAMVCRGLEASSCFRGWQLCDVGSLGFGPGELIALSLTRWAGMYINVSQSPVHEMKFLRFITASLFFSIHHLLFINLTDLR